MKLFLLLLPMLVMSIPLYAENTAGRGTGIVLNAAKDIKSGEYKYLLIGQPMAHDEQFKKVLKNKYNITLVSLGCAPGSKEAKQAESYNNTIIPILEKKHGKSFLANAENEAKQLYESTRKP